MLNLPQLMQLCVNLTAYQMYDLQAQPDRAAWQLGRLTARGILTAVIVPKHRC